MWLWRLSLQVPCLRCRNNLDLRMIVCNIKVEAPRKAMTPSGRKLLKVPWTPDYISIFHNYVYSLGYILSVSGHQKLRPDPARPDDPPFWPDPTTSLVQTHLLTERHIQIMYQTSGKRVSAQWKPRTVPIPQKVTLFHSKTYLNTNDNKVSGQFNLLCFWITHNHIFTANVKSQKCFFQ